MQTNHDTFSEEEKAVKQSLDGLSGTARQSISISSVAAYLNNGYWENFDFLERFVRDGILVWYNVLCCLLYGYDIKKK